MIQRIQSLYLLLTTALLIAVLFLPFGAYQTPDEMYEYAAFSIQQVGAAGLFGLPVWILAALSVFSAVLSFGSIFFYKKRPVQKRLCISNAIVIAVLVLISLAFILIVNSKSQACFMPGGGSILPLVALIFDLLAIRSISKDDALVKSWDRIR